MSSIVEPIPIQGTDGALHPFFSPDGAWIGFFTADALKKVALAGGPSVTLVEQIGRRGASWGPDDTIVFASSDARGLMRVSATGGEPEALTMPRSDEEHYWPEFLPDGRSVLFTTSTSGQLADKRVAVLSLETGDQRILLEGTDGHFASSGHLVFGREGSLWAAGFDATRLELTSEPTLMTEGVQVNQGGGWAQYALADDGSLVYLPDGSERPRRLVWVDRQGQERVIPAPARAYHTPRMWVPNSRVRRIHEGSKLTHRRSLSSTPSILMPAPMKPLVRR